MLGWAWWNAGLHNRRDETSIVQVSAREEFRYRRIAGLLRVRIEAGEFPAGRLLPSESELSKAYDASRVTVRKALEALRDDGLIDSRQGFGWFVAAVPVRQTLARLATIEGQLSSLGSAVERRVLDFGFQRAPARVRSQLELAVGDDRVLHVRRVNLADGEPFARVTVWVPDDLAAELSRGVVERSTFYEALPVTIGGATQTIGAAAASPADAALLAIPVDSPVLRCERLTRATDGRPVLFSEFVFPGHRTEFVVELPQAEVSVAPTGLRLVE